MNGKKSPARMRHQFHETLARALGNLGLTVNEVMVCPVDRHTKSGLVVYRKRFLNIDRNAGNPVPWKAIAIAGAQARKNALIGFLYPDGNIRNDSEMTVNDINKQIEIPIFVLFYEDHVPMNSRKHLACGKDHFDQPIVIGPK